MERFDLLTVPLNGANLLEAAAGTGKTFAIEGLYLRLIIEKALSVGEILVVTYTVAATEELRDRIRRRLRAAAEAFRRGESTEPLLAKLLEQFPHPQEQRLVQERLRAALRDFDEAAIHTIHSFCQRILQENAFESDTLFDTELITDERMLRTEVCEDFWRSNFYETLPEVAGFALARRFTPEFLWRLLGTVTSRPGLRIIPETTPPSLDRIKEQVGAFNSAFDDFVHTWPQVRGEVQAILKSPALHAGVYGPKVDSLMKEMDAFLSSGGSFFPLFDNFIKFTTNAITGKVKKGHTPLRHEAFNRCQALKEQADSLDGLLEGYLLSLKGEFIRTAAKRLSARKERENLMFFDDLLMRLRAALEKRGGEELARLMRKKFRAALIDEFQDTDPIQFAIFHTVFGDGALPLFLIGDPKQAIYSFRGADIFAYMKAARSVGGTYHLGENWRSEPGLIKAVNSLFAAQSNPFLYEEISFRPSESPEGKTYDFLTLAGMREAPFQWWFIPADDGEGKPLSKERAEGIICRAVAGEIERLLTLARRGEALIGERSLREEDIAVLVRTHRQARLIQEALRNCRIPSVLHKSGNIFETREAEEIERMMMGVAMPEDEPFVRAALLTDMLGLSLEDLGGLMTDEESWGRWLVRFGLYHDLWFETGFMGMFSALMAGEGVKSRILSLPDGERRMTNLLHLAELLHCESEAQGLGMLSLVTWLAEQRNVSPQGEEEHQLRLESDERAVRVVTIHQSKGLEYPVVFCPFTWEASEVRGDVVSFHEDDGDEGITVDLGSPDIALSQERALREVLAENVRLLYVALTRAKNRCYFVWGRFNKAGTSAPAYLFHHGNNGKHDGGNDGRVSALAAEYRQMDDASLYRRLDEIAAHADGNIALGEIPTPRAGEVVLEPPDEGILISRQFTGAIDRTWRIISYSSLVSDLPHLAESPDYDGMSIGAPHTPGLPVAERSEDETTPRDIFSFPRGARAGIVLHDILRYLDFQKQDEQTLRPLVRQKLQERGFEAPWDDAIIAMLRRVVSVPLLPFPGGDDQIHTLAEIAPDDRLNELEFTFPLRRIASQDLNDILSCAGFLKSDARVGEGGQTSRDYLLHHERLQFSPARGFMKGFMDLVYCFGGRFYLVDWKSNFLGGQVTDYGQEALACSMAENCYTLQYHLYALALHQYLTARLPDYRYERHFGGVYYLFLRGIDPAFGPQYGVFQDRPQEALVREMQQRLIDH